MRYFHTLSYYIFLNSLLLLLSLLFHLFPQSAFSSQAAPFTGKVISISDGDTITVINMQNEQIKIRLSGVDTPEGGQAYGNKAKQFTSSMVFKKNVTIEPETVDRYGRTVAMVLVDGRNLNEQLIVQGYGWVFRKYCTWGFCDDWLKLEEKARVARIGLWADKNPVAPWDWRAEKRSGNNTDDTIAVDGGAGIYHGNVKSHVFHGSGCKDYNCKNCTAVFRSACEAISAEYRGHRDCVK